MLVIIFPCPIIFGLNSFFNRQHVSKDKHLSIFFCAVIMEVSNLVYIQEASKCTIYVSCSFNDLGPLQSRSPTAATASASVLAAISAVANRMSSLRTSRHINLSTVVIFILSIYPGQITWDFLKKCREGSMRHDFKKIYFITRYLHF